MIANCLHYCCYNFMISDVLNAFLIVCYSSDDN